MMVCIICFVCLIDVLRVPKYVCVLLEILVCVLKFSIRLFALPCTRYLHICDIRVLPLHVLPFLVLGFGGCGSFVGISRMVVGVRRRCFEMQQSR